MRNPTGTRTEIIVSTSGMAHAPKRDLFGNYVRRYRWRITVCGQLAEYGWSQHREFGYVECRSCVRMLEEVSAEANSS
jgi:hypothetical protein